jgi:hypothetical protein
MAVNKIKYSTSNLPNSIRKGNMAIGVRSTGYGPTSTTGFYNGYPVSSSGYVIYVNKESNGPSIYAPSNDSGLIDIVKKLGGTSINTAVDALSWVNGQSNMVVVNRQYTNMITDGLVLCLDPSFVASYPKGNNIWYDVSGNNSNVTLSNGPSFNTEGIGNIVFDGSDDYANFSVSNLGTTTTVEMLVKMGGAYSGKMFFGFLLYDVWCGGSNLGYNTAQGDLYGISAASVSSLGLVDNWKHYVFEMRSDVSYTNNKIYINGVSQSLSQQFGGEGAGNRNFNGGNGRISSWLADLGYPMPMNCGSFKIYNRALTTSEILQNYYKNDLITTNITHRWDFSNVVSYSGSGTSVKNLTGTVNGILYNSPTYKPELGGYITFDGTNDYMELIGGNYAITLGDGNSPWTVSAWIRTTTTANGLGNGPILTNSSGGPVYSMLGVNDGRMVYWVYPSNIDNWKSFNGTITVTDGNWHLLTWVQNTGYSMNMYVDGILDSTVSPTNAGNNNPVDRIGGSFAGAYFNGDIGEVQINTKAFDSADVIQQYTSTKLRYQIPNGPVKNGLIMHWDPANVNSYPGSGTAIYDLSGNGNHGTLYNGVGFSRVNGGVLTFDGVDDYVRGGPNMYNSNYTLMGASRYVTINGRVIAATNNYLLGHWAGYTNDHYAEGWVYYNPAISDTNWSIYAGSGDIGNDSYQFYMNNTQLASNNGGSQGPAEIVLGCYGPGYEFSNAQVGPILLYNRVLTSVELNQNYNYLRGRFSL